MKGEIAPVSDTLALRVPGPVGSPDDFVASGDRRSATAIWIVRDASGQAIGHYRGYFVASSAGFSLAELDVVEGDAAPAALTPFCSQPGDVEQFLATHDRRGRPLQPAPAQ